MLVTERGLRASYFLMEPTFGEMPAFLFWAPWFHQSKQHSWIPPSLEGIWGAGVGQLMRKISLTPPDLVPFAKKLAQQHDYGEIFLWQRIKKPKHNWSQV